ncbi:hypothetical protein [Acidithiobacillus albertensis]|uniref:hypothetical protein n=1 Tax=Acidithiobacillus albertensis TaxID=119978 RepID=UPI001C078FBD|nr:hypothetical protein [Acidithiobacillus albertensis]MBU2741549.1 hypothetical protein [Acidithiobacillus albertensis]
MEKLHTKDCLFWFSTTLISTIIAALFGLLAITTDFPEVSKLLIGLLAGLWVMCSLLWGAHAIERAEWDDDLPSLLRLVAILFAVGCGSTLFTVALVQVLPA